MSKARTGLGTVLSIATGTSTYTPVAELRSIKGSGRQADTDDVTNFDSLGKEFIATIIDPGEWDIEGNYISSDTGQAALETNFAALATVGFKIVLPKTSTQTTGGDTFTFNAVITELTYTPDPTKAITFTSKLKISGTLTLVKGS